MPYYVSSEHKNGKSGIGPYSSCDEACRVAENIMANRSNEKWKSVRPLVWESRDGLQVKVVNTSEG